MAYHKTLAVMLTLAAAAYLPVTLTANSIQLDSTQFGHLDQANVTDCNNGGGGINSACGPTAVVNSLVFLQNTYQTIYGTSLVPHTAGNTAIQDQTAVGQTLACYQSCGENGTTIDEFINGKEAYINSVAPNTTYFKVQNSFAPGGVDPTFNFLYSELVDREDVELLVGFYSVNPTNGLLVRNGGHYITLTGISSATNDGNGTISFVDPSGGVDMNNIATFLATDGSIRTTAYLSGTNPVTIIEAAVSESPIPEPGTLLFMFGTIPVALLLRRFRPAA
jgi:hypothetical protein